MSQTLLSTCVAVLAALLALPALAQEAGPQREPLLTRWAAEVTPENAHREYPRPQLLREAWQCLNGEWEIEVDPASEAPRFGKALPERILVPFPIESTLSGIARPCTTALYRRTFDVPRDWRGQRLLLHFGAVDWQATVYLNGTRLGEHQGGYDAFSFDITDSLKGNGPQELIVHVFDPSDAGTQPRGKQVEEPGGIYYTPSTGIWQSVWLEPVAATHIERLKLETDIDASQLHVIADIAEMRRDLLVEMVVTVDGEDIASSSGGAVQMIEIPKARLWSPDDPFLYDLQIQLIDAETGKTVDRVQSYFGMRSVELIHDADGHAHLALNGRELFQVGPLDQGFWPDGLHTAPTDEALRYDIEITKKLGFNTIRKHVKVEPLRWYTWCDRLGVVVWQDMPSGDAFPKRGTKEIERTPESAAQYYTELTRMIEGLYNHPSIIMWVPFNESWGQFETRKVADYVKNLDPTRLVNPVSGWHDMGGGEVRDIHSYPGPDAPEPERERATVLGEFGGLGLPVEGHTWSEHTWGYRGLHSPEELNRRYEALFRRVWDLKKTQALSAVIYTQTTDVETECNGLLTYDREVMKVDVERIRAANQGMMPRLTTIVPTARDAKIDWRYTTADPGADWTKPRFDDSDWQIGPAGFGRADTPGASIGTEWLADEIWLRRDFELEALPQGDLYLEVHHDEDVQIYLNGVLAAEEKGYTTNYTELPIAAAARQTLRAGTNHLAVYCKQTNGGQYIDVGIVSVQRWGKKKTVQVEPLQAVPFTAVHIEDAFWRQRIETNREVTVPYCFEKCEETGRLSNFAKAGGLLEGEFEGIYFNDSDVYKVIEGACYTLAQEYDKELDQYLDNLIANIAAAQWDDGYLNTYYTLVAPEKRWTHLSQMHELYCAGHLFEAAVAHHQATGKRSLLDVARRFADHIDSIFGPGQRYDVPGHEEIEIGLVKLFHETGEKRYLELAEFFIDQRGDDTHRDLYGGYCQDHQPVIEQDEPTGHAVRAMYLYCGMADVAALTGDKGYLEALDRIWNNQTQRKLYLTGGIGARHAGEAFGDDYELPNDSAYNETCAAIGNGLWNHRMNLLHADAKYIDVLERVIYNGFLSGVSLEGNTFFYPNPLSSAGSYHRSPWFGCSCCPVNVVRFLPSIAGFVYAQRDETVYANLYVASTARFDFNGEELELVQRTDYPWEGKVELTVEPGRARRFELALRVPGWAVAEPVPSDLYEYIDNSAGGARITVNGKRARDVEIKNGYALLERTWKPGDVVGIEMPMPVRTVRSHEAVDADRGRVAFERGPIVYCLEAVDTGGHVRPLWVEPEVKLTPEARPNLLGGVTVLTGTALARQQEEVGGPVRDVETPITAIPYAVWDHRQAGEMAVWIPTDPALAIVVPPPTLASRSQATTSFSHSQDSPTAVNDQLEPKSSADHDVPRLTWWPHKGTEEWVQLDLPESSRISGVEVYWFDDTGRGECRLPASWRLLYRQGESWKPVRTNDAYGVAGDAYNRVRFEAVHTQALRLEVQLRKGYSSGMLEWRLLAGED